MHAGNEGKEELLSVRKEGKNRTLLRVRSVGLELKDISRRNGLSPDYFSAHFLTKGGITLMRARGVTEDDRRDRGNYTAGSHDFVTSAR